MTGRRTAKPPLYPGKLNEPLEPGDDEPISSPPGEFELRPEFNERFELLFKHFSISKDHPERWKKLALALAKNHVPGFQEKQPETRGRPSKWEISDEFVLCCEFVFLQISGKSERQAAKILSERHPEISDSSAALLIRLKRFEKRFKAALAEYLAVYWAKHKRR